MSYSKLNINCFRFNFYNHSYGYLCTKTRNLSYYVKSIVHIFKTEKKTKTTKTFNYLKTIIRIQLRMKNYYQFQLIIIGYIFRKIPLGGREKITKKNYAYLSNNHDNLRLDVRSTGFVGLVASLLYCLVQLLVFLFLRHLM